MGADRRREQWTDFDDLMEPTDVGRRLDAGGFIVADPFDTLLRELSEAYVHAPWQRVLVVLDRYSLHPDDLSWGDLHLGETYAPGFPPPAPNNFIGWTSRQLAWFDRDDERYGDVDAALRAGRPAIGCAFSWRSLKWRIAPSDTALGLQLFEALCIGEPSDWAPNVILRQGHSASTPAHAEGPWLEVARAIQDGDQQRLDAALAVARAQYSLVGYRVMVRGYAAYVHPGLDLQVRLPDVSS